MGIGISFPSPLFGRYNLVKGDMAKLRRDDLTPHVIPNADKDQLALIALAFYNSEVPFYVRFSESFQRRRYDVGQALLKNPQIEEFVQDDGLFDKKKLILTVARHIEDHRRWKPHFAVRKGQSEGKRNLLATLRDMHGYDLWD
jgi:hypothetical protein